jgi:general secretion pathway protein G
MRQRVARGFTLIELLATLAILGVLAGITVPLAEISTQRERENELRRSLREIRQAIDAYKQASDEGRIPRDAGSSGYPRTLEALVEGVIDARDPKRGRIYFLRQVPRDPMLTDISISPSATWRKRSYASEAAEPKEGDDIYDVASASTRIGLNGLAYATW